MSNLKSGIQTLDLIAADAAAVAKFIVFSFLIFSAFTAIFSVGSFLSYFILNDETRAFEMFYAYMNYKHFGISETFRLMISTLNWFSLVSILLFGIYSIYRYLSEVSAQADWNSRIAASRKIEYFPENEHSSQNSNSDIKQAGNS